VNAAYDLDERILALIRAWARGERPAMTRAELRRFQTLPTEAEQLARHYASARPTGRAT